MRRRKIVGVINHSSTAEEIEEVLGALDRFAEALKQGGRNAVRKLYGLEVDDAKD